MCFGISIQVLDSFRILKLFALKFHARFLLNKVDFITPEVGDCIYFISFWTIIEVDVLIHLGTIIFHIIRVLSSSDSIAFAPLFPCIIYCIPIIRAFSFIQRVIKGFLSFLHVFRGIGFEFPAPLSHEIVTLVYILLRYSI
jgi:hypothetical protein